MVQVGFFMYDLNGHDLSLSKVCLGISSSCCCLHQVTKTFALTFIGEIESGFFARYICKYYNFGACFVLVMNPLISKLSCNLSINKILSLSCHFQQVLISSAVGAYALRALLLLFALKARVL